MSTLVHFKRTLNDLNLEKIKQQAEHSWLSSQTMPTEIVDVLVTEVKQLRRELHDEQTQHDEWEKMYNQAIAGTKVEQLQERLGQMKITLDHEVNSRVRAELEVERLQKELTHTQALLDDAPSIVPI